MSKRILKYSEDFIRNFCEEFEWTRPRHSGLCSVAAPIFNLSPRTVAKYLTYGKTNFGIVVSHVDDSTRARLSA